MIMSDAKVISASAMVRIWTGKLVLNAERNKPGNEVEARIVLAGPCVTFLVREPACDWREAKPDEVHAASWLRALGATGSEVG